MSSSLPTDSLTLAVLASRAGPNAEETLDGVLAFTGTGTRLYQPLHSVPAGTDIDGRNGLAGLDHSTLRTTPPTSSGLTWRTWALVSVPVAIRHLPPAEAVTALARALRRLPA